MKIRTILFSLFAICLIPTQAQTIITGVIKDSIYPIPYVSVFVKNHPANGTSTAMDGAFRLTIEPQNISDTLVISFVGYRSVQLPIHNISTTVPLDVTLKQYFIDLPQVEVKTTKRRKADTSLLIKMVLEQMDKDFEHIEAIYHTQTNSSIASNDKMLGYQESIVDIYEKSRHDKDQTRKIQTKVFIDKRTKSKMESIDSLKGIDPTSSIKGLTVSEGMIRDYLKEKAKNWKLSAQTDTQYILTFEDKMGFLGIFKYKNKCVLYIQRSTYSIQRADVFMDVNLNIPFGKKLPKDALPYLNILNIKEQDIDKFRLRKMEANATMSSVFSKKGSSIYRGNSYSVAKARVQSTKEVIYIDVKSEQKILSVQTQDVLPFTKAEETQKGTLINVDVLGSIVN